MRRAGRNVVCLLVLAVLSVAGRRAQSTANAGGIDGCWQLTAHFPDYDLDTLVVFKSGADARSVEGTVLGPTGGRAGSFIGSISNDHLTLKAPGPLGEMRVDLTLSDNTLSGTWATGELGGQVRGSRRASRKPEPTYYAKYLKAVLQLIRGNFYDPRFNGVALEQLTENSAEQLANVKDDADFVILVRHLLGQFKSSHTDFFLAPDNSPVTDRTPPVTSRSLPTQTHYIRIRHFDPPSVEDFNQALDRALDEAGKSASLILDLRGNRGGSVSLALRSLGHFVQPGQDVGYAIARAGTNRIASISNIAATSTPGFPVVRSSSTSMIGEIIRNGASVIRIDAGPKPPYEGRIAVLIDERCYSACELFSAILRDSRGAILIGSRTGGEVLGSYTYSIAKNMVIRKKDTGWRLEVPVVDFRRMSGERIEGKGVKPDIEVAKSGAADSVLSEALKYLQSR